ncbi:MAG: hypothetical protein ACKVQQ_14045 [Burkholderiales bacterium]
MQVLHCSRCQTLFPLSHPRRVGNVWYALCGDCKQDTEVEPVLRSEEHEHAFRVKQAAGAASRSG